ncbi:hypothetical protein [Halorubrum sp. Boch-26]|uniref:hypothetical protein n=1 Tax=Halorubrum sp. Boch-26 TaxID=2994426 RepID=UPI00246958C8|nr:hypothetical protein [Halorubrum sp. Boch-26]
MKRRAVVAGILTVASAGCTDRLRDIAASTPRDLAVRSRYVDGDPLVEGQSVRSLPEGLLTHAASFRSKSEAKAAVLPDQPEATAFVEATSFVDDGGESVLIVAQRLTVPEVELRLGSVSRTGDRSLRVAVDLAGVRGEIETDDPVVKTLLLRLTDERGPPTRIIVSIEGDRAGVTV